MVDDPGCYSYKAGCNFYFFKNLQQYKIKQNKKVSNVFNKRKPIASSLKFNDKCFYGE